MLAEAQGFEPWVPFSTSVFKTGALNHSATLPFVMCLLYLILYAKSTTFYSWANLIRRSSAQWLYIFRHDPPVPRVPY